MTHKLDVRVKRVPLRAAAVVVLGLLVSACTPLSPPLVLPPQNLCESQASLANPDVGQTGGIGGTGAPRASVEPGGIGGTGILAGKPVFGDGGIGGTGIVGVITGFASICVNGLEVQYDATTPVWDNGRPSTARQLAVGQVVSLAAAGSGAQPKARGIAVIHALVGPVSAVNATTGKLVVLGQAATALQPGDLGDLGGLRPGDWVQVSGHRLANGEIMASRVQPISAPPEAVAQVRGPVHSVSGNTVKVGDTSLQLSAGAMPAGLRAGQELWATGPWNGKVMMAQELVVEPTRAGLGRIDQVVLEGYIQRLGPRDVSLGFEPLLLPEGVQIVGGTAAELAVNRRVQINGRVGPDQRITVERVEFSNASAGDGSGGRGRGSSGRGGSSSGKGSGGSGSSNSGSSNSGSGGSGSGSSGSGSSGSGSSGSGSGSSGSGSSGSGSSGGGSGGGSSGSGSGK